MSVTVLGIRHHGPGSARSVLHALEELRPDAVLVEGPPDADEILPLAADGDMRPPVAILVYRPDAPRRAVYYPFAEFSPEWQAIRWALAHEVPVRFMDLPHAHRMARGAGKARGTASEAHGMAHPPPRRRGEGAAVGEVTSEAHGMAHPPPRRRGEGAAAPRRAAGDGDGDGDDRPVDADEPDDDLPDERDPLAWLARAAGHEDGERWWDLLVEQRRDPRGLFAAILEAMTALRAELETTISRGEARREAWMRQTIRAAEREGHQRIAVVCGAWHAPALATRPPASHDAAILRGLPRVKVAATWVPWTHGRLALASGYGAGIESPGWYHHLFTCRDAIAERWLAHVARLLRGQDLDAASAQIIDGVRLAETLAALRGRPLAGLPELNDAARAVLCGGADLPMRLVHERLIVGETLGAVPERTPTVPLVTDVLAQARRLRLPVEASDRVVDLDLRKARDRERSHLLHRLAALGAAWGERAEVAGKSGTFREPWHLRWEPELAVALIEAGVWGNTVLDAATAKVRDETRRAADLPAVSELLDRALVADLGDAVPDVMGRLDALAAVATDVAHLGRALPPLARVLRYGNVRRTDAEAVAHVVDGLVARIAVGLPAACGSLDDDAAAAIFDLIMAVHEAIGLLGRPADAEAWLGALTQLSGRDDVHGLIVGRACRLLLDAGALPPDEAARRAGLALSPAAEPGRAAAWAEGFLRGSGLLLLHDDTVWEVVDRWIAGLPAAAFVTLLPLLRRTFTTFAAGERRRMGERARHETSGNTARTVEGPLDGARADAVLPLVARVLGLDAPSDGAAPEDPAVASPPARDGGAP